MTSSIIPADPQKPTRELERPFRFDLRYALLAYVLLPVALWVSAGLYLRSSSNRGTLGALVCGALGVVIVQTSGQFSYWLARKTCRKHVGTSPGQDYLLLEIEDPRTYDKLKLVPEDCGIFISHGGAYCIITPYRTYQANPAEFAIEDTNRSGVLLKFIDHSTKEPIELIATFKYVGKDSQVVRNPDRRRAWTRDAISKIRPQEPTAM